MRNIEINTSHGPARITLREAEDPRAILILGPGASGSVSAADLALAAMTAHAAGISSAIVQPPYAVAGKKVPPRGPAADEAWLEVIEQLQPLSGHLPRITGGRSFGSRVACRTASASRSIGVLCLAFPFHPPGRPDATRIADLEAAGDVPVLIIQGRSDPFGHPPAGLTRRIVDVDGDHGLKKQPDVIRAALVDWFTELLDKD